MKIRDLLEVLNTDSVVLARENDILVDCETPYINQALREYMDEEIKRITPLDDVGVKTINKFNPIPYSTLKNSYFVVYRRGLGNI